MAAQMKLAAFGCWAGGYHQAGWRHPTSDTNGSDIQLWIDFAKKLEAAKFDMLFVADFASIPDADKPDVFPYTSFVDGFEPVSLCSALSAHTRHLGLGCTVATSYRPPYDTAREFASLDLISGGRAGWNIVTGASPDDATQYAAQALPPAEERYRRGEEFVDVVLKLWASVEPDAFPRDKASGAYADAAKIHLINHKGRYYQVRGPLNVAPSPQRRPVLIQAGQSEEGRQLASRVAEVVFTAQSTFEPAKAYRDDLHRRAADWGRNPADLKILPGCVAMIGESRQEAEDKWGELGELINLKWALARMQLLLRSFDLSAYDLDGPFPEIPAEGLASRGVNFVEDARREGLTLRQVLVKKSGVNAHFTPKGTAKDVADEMEYWFKEGACDGFNMQSATMPASLDAIISKLVPELQRRGLFRTEYEGQTLRENLGLSAAPIPLRS